MWRNIFMQRGIRPQRGSKRAIQGLRHLNRLQTGLVLLGLAGLIGLMAWPARAVIFASNTQAANYWQLSPLVGTLHTAGNWSQSAGDLLYTVEFSRADQPFGPLVVYRASGADLRTAAPVIVVNRGQAARMETPLAYPSPDGRMLALLSPNPGGSNLDGASLTIVSTGGALPNSSGIYHTNVASVVSDVNAMLIAQHAAMTGPVIWSADSRALYYESGLERVAIPGAKGSPSNTQVTGDIEVHRVTLTSIREDGVLLREPLGSIDLRVVGLDRTGALILTGARTRQPVAVLRLPTGGFDEIPETILALPSDILPGSVLGIGSDGNSLLIERTTGQRTMRVS